MWMLFLVSVVSWIILTLLRVGIHLFLANGLSIKRANGHWLYLTPQIILITIYSYAVVAVFQGFDKESFLVLGAIWLVLVLCFEFIGVLVIQKKSLDELFEGWKIWKGHIWTLVLLSHLFMPYLIKQIAE
jgi:hypothetical protein